MRLPITLLRGALVALVALAGGCSDGGGGADKGCNPACGAGELCVVFYDGQCNLLGGSGQCVATACGLDDCDAPAGGASGPCNIELCNGGQSIDGGNTFFICGHACGDEPPGTFRCYGP